MAITTNPKSSAPDMADVPARVGIHHGRPWPGEDQEERSHRLRRYPSDGPEPVSLGVRFPVWEPMIHS